jgi:hypothetical protein
MLMHDVTILNLLRGKDAVEREVCSCGDEIEYEIEEANPKQRCDQTRGRVNTLGHQRTLQQPPSCWLSQQKERGGRYIDALFDECT